VFNWATVVLNARNRRRGVARNVSKIFLVSQTLVVIAASILSSAYLAWPPRSV